jgi:signal transduction histidine kinase
MGLSRMNSLPRFIALALFVVLTALVAMTAVSAWRVLKTDAPAAAGSPGSSEAPPPSSQPSPRAAALALRLMLGLALLSAGLALALVIALARRPIAAPGSRPPFAHARHEIGTIAMLAENSAATDAELHRERDVRRRAEEDAQLRQQLLDQSFEEKIRLGRNLHDGIIQSLYALGLTIESVRGLLKDDIAEADRRLEQTRKNLNNTIRDVRAYITGLTPTNLRRASFRHAVTAQLTELTAGQPAEFDVKIDDDAAALLTPEQSLETLQIAREAVSNALRHGHASHITVRVHQSEREICLLVQDNGRGFDAGSRRDGGHGLANMHARAKRLGASLRVTSEAGQGSRVIATLPIVGHTTV